ncbi:hypothetical protein Nepgr_013906 [Nepenthes gracilis]|uniref:Uncharacterized protein n=1 Tax=Nepenthes gracilis TaxID=150966 RepID=A0AAD3SI96_NEPGR|nr:hypothetical protein Nepgr_013906 [Nepenthes gracilis]
MKNASRNKFLLCFRPEEIDQDAVDRSADRVPSYLSISNEGEATKILRSTSFSDQKPISRRCFSAVIKAVLYKTSLSKRILDRKRRKRSDSDHFDQSDNRKQSNGPQQSVSDLSSDQTSKFLQKLTEISSGENPPGQPASENSKSTPHNENRNRPNLSGSRGNTNRKAVTTISLSLDYVMYLMVFSLWFTVFYGTSSAVMMATIWIYAARFRGDVGKGRESVRRKLRGKAILQF